MKLKNSILILLMPCIFYACAYNRQIVTPPAALEIQPDTAPVRWSQANSLKPINDKIIVADDLTRDSLLNALDNSIKYIYKRNESDTVSIAGKTATIKRIKDSLTDFKDKLELYDLTDTFYEYISNNYEFFRSSADTVLFTGYYEASLNGSLIKSDTYKYPLYSTPGDLYKIDLTKFSFFSKFTGLPKTARCRITPDKKILPYYTRAEIDSSGALAGLNCELVWCDNPIDIFFLQIQGSGIVKLDNGDSMRVNYADENGHQYKPIGKLLIEKKAIPKELVTMQTIRAYLNAHPDQVAEIFNYNPSYVFFRRVNIGPLGMLDAPLTQWRSIATDSKIFPKAAICFIETELPEFDEQYNLTGWRKIRRFVLNQDTGGAIAGPGRVDIFTGFGKLSEQTAGVMKQTGNLYFILKKNEL